jgi:glutaredoxin 3
MQKITVYTMKYCPYCDSAKRLLKSKGFAFEEVMVADDDDAAWTRLEKLTGYKTMPQIFVGEKFVGGYNDLAALDAKGELDPLVQK